MNELILSELVSLIVNGVCLISANQTEEFSHTYKGTAEACILAVDKKFNCSFILEALDKGDTYTAMQMVDIMREYGMDDEIFIAQMYIKRADGSTISLKGEGEICILEFNV